MNWPVTWIFILIMVRLFAGGVQRREERGASVDRRRPPYAGFVEFLERIER